MTLTKTELIELLSEENGYTKKESQEYIEAVNQAKLLTLWIMFKSLRIAAIVKLTAVGGVGASHADTPLECTNEIAPGVYSFG